MNQSLVLILFSLDTLKWHHNDFGFNCSLEGRPGQPVMAAAFLTMCPTEISIGCALLTPVTIQIVFTKLLAVFYFLFLHAVCCRVTFSEKWKKNPSVVLPVYRFGRLSLLPQLTLHCVSHSHSSERLADFG